MWIRVCFQRCPPQGTSVSDQQTTLWVCILSFTLKIPEQLELHVLQADSFEINLQKTTQNKQPRELQPYPIIGTI